MKFTQMTLLSFIILRSKEEFYLCLRTYLSGLTSTALALIWKCRAAERMVRAHSTGGSCDKARVGPGLFSVDTLSGSPVLSGEL